MLSSKYSVLIVFLAMIMTSWTTVVNAEVLELGESQLRGKKDQPEVMTFISRAPLDTGPSVLPYKAIDKIRQELKRDIFKRSQN